MKAMFKAVEGSHISDANAEKYGARINALVVKHGFVTPQDVVDDAAKMSSPLHDYFEWDDTEAAAAYRIEQAKMLIRSIAVTIVSENKPVIRQFFSVSPTPNMETKATKVYISLDKVMSDSDRRREVVEFALRELRGWTTRYAQYAELSKLTQVISNELKRIDTHEARLGEVRRV